MSEPTKFEFNPVVTQRRVITLPSFDAPFESARDAQLAALQMVLPVGLLGAESILKNADQVIKILQWQPNGAPVKTTRKPRGPHVDWATVAWLDAKDDEIADARHVTLRTVRRARARWEAKQKKTTA